MTGPVAPAPAPVVTPTEPAPVAPTSVVVAQPTFVGPVAAAPSPPPPAEPVEAPVAPVVGPPAGPVAAPVAVPVDAPVAAPVLVTEPADPLALPSFPDPVMDAPPPVEPEPDSAVGPPAIVVIGDGTVIEIGGVVQDGEAVEPPDGLPDGLPVELPVSDTATAAIG
ncbi:MAG: hypothetical protein EPN99_02900 [Frankiales bacterium]|nr:MAG: hypothetical protein EPN99_02900 [Frankiales bacterium]